MYGNQLNLPAMQDSQAAFQEYLEIAQQRMKENRLRPGEQARMIGGRVAVSGHTAVMEINGMLVRRILDKNPGHEVYLEESFPLDWMYPHLSPLGLILKLSREPLLELSEEVVARDRAYWTRYGRELMDDWLTDETSVREICEFGERVFLKKDLTGFAGGADFARNASAQKAFSRLRSANGGVYAWRAANARSESEKRRMTEEAEFAFRQALALCPYSPEAVHRSVELFLGLGRKGEAQQVADLCLCLNPSADGVKQLATRIRSAE